MGAGGGDRGTHLVRDAFSFSSFAFLISAACRLPRWISISGDEGSASSAASLSLEMPRFRALLSSWKSSLPEPSLSHLPKSEGRG